MQIQKQIEEAQARFYEKFVKNQNGFEVVQPFHIDEFNNFLETELSRIATKSAEREIRTLETVLALLNGDKKQVDVLKTYAFNKLKMLRLNKE